MVDVTEQVLPVMRGDGDASALLSLRLCRASVPSTLAQNMCAFFKSVLRSDMVDADYGRLRMLISRRDPSGIPNSSHTSYNATAFVFYFFRDGLTQNFEGGRGN